MAKKDPKVLRDPRARSVIVAKPLSAHQAILGHLGPLAMRVTVK